MRDQKRWMKNWIRALAVGTMIAAAVPLSVMAAEKGWVNEDGVAHYVDSNGSYVKNQWKTSQGVSYYLDDKKRQPQLEELKIKNPAEVKVVIQPDGGIILTK